MFVIGGRSDELHDEIPVDTYDIEKRKWTQYPPFQRVRHQCLVFDSKIYV